MWLLRKFLTFLLQVLSMKYVLSGLLFRWVASLFFFSGTLWFCFVYFRWFVWYRLSHLLTTTPILPPLLWTKHQRGGNAFPVFISDIPSAHLFSLVQHHLRFVWLLVFSCRFLRFLRFCSSSFPVVPWGEVTVIAVCGRHYHQPTTDVTEVTDRVARFPAAF